MRLAPNPTMKIKRIVAAATIVCGAASAGAQRTGSASRPVWPDRAVRRDIPLQLGIRRAYAQGTRDSSGAPGHNYWQQSVDYRINANLDTHSGILHGSEVVTLHNTTPNTLDRVVLRLYQNYFKPTVQRNDYVTDITEGMVMERLTVNGTDVPLNDATRYSVQGTVASVKLGSPIAANASATIEATWHFSVPRVDTLARAERTGRYADYLYQVAQWYPQVAMYDDMRGWDTDQYMGIGEFYNQFGSFDVNLTVPGGWLVGATGDLQNANEVLSQRTRDRLALATRVDTTVHVVTAAERGVSATAAGATLTWHFTAPHANDFAFATSRDYVYDATHANIPTRTSVPVNVLYLPQHTAYATNNTAQLGRFALEHHSRYVFPYEFSQGTIADGPETGMEYPMIIFDGPGFGVTVHEFGHEWFPMTVSSDETRYGWMDEGFNEYIDAAAAGDYNHKPIDLNGGSEGYRAVAGSELEGAMMWPTDFLGPNATMTTYVKAPLMFHALGGVVGDSAAHVAFANYAKEWRFRHPSPYDFFMSMNRSLGRNLDWFWYQWAFATYTTDQALASVVTRGGNALVSVNDRGDMAMPIILRVEYTDGSSDTVVQDADVWFTGTRHVTMTIPLRGKTVERATLDPDNRFQDVDRSNNSWSRSR
ncbi:MAG: M1 family metallopeptidase [Gemmatimonadota bacterium]|nr:M1 family metallopeptidase [Gemmatimonadota bacterium]